MIETIALGRPDPVSGANPYRFFHLPVVNRSGDISFVADTSSNLTIPAVHSVFTMPSGGAIEGRLVSGSGGFLTIPQVLLNRSEFSTNQFRDPYVPLADDGTNYALAGLNLIGSGILAADGNGFAFLVQDGGSAPGTGGKVFTDFTDAPFTAIRTNAQSDVAFIGVLANSGSPNTPSGVGIFEVSEGISVLAAAPGNAVSGAGTLQGISFAALSFNATREVAFIGTLGSNNSAIIRQDGASLTGIAIQGEVAPGMNSATIQIVGFDIAVIDVPGTFALDPSFNRGGDILRLEGSAADWSVVRIGSSALFSDGDTFVTVPVGSAGLPVVFDDGVRELKFDNVAGGFTIGGDPFGFGTFVPVDAAPDGNPLPTGSDPTAKGLLFLAAGAGASAAGVVDIFGTSSAEPVSLISGTITLDPSFNRGGDTVRFDELATDFTATRTGSSILLDGSDTQALVPVGTAGATLTFGNGSDMRVIQFDGTIPGFVIGTQVIGFDPVQLTAA